MLLDIFERDQAATLDDGRRRLAPELPAGFAQEFDRALEAQLLFGNSIGQLHARERAARDIVDGIYERTGVRLPLPTGMWDPARGAVTLAEFNKQLDGLRDKHPDLPPPLDDDELNRRAVLRAREARAEGQRERETTVGGTIGGLLGTVTGAVVDPINIMTLPFGVAGSAGIMRTALTEAGIAGGSQLAIEAAASPFQRQADPTLTVGEQVGNVAEAAGFGFLLGGGIRGFQHVWQRYRTGEWPRTVRDAANVMDSESNVANTNVFPGAEGEVQHRTALQKAIDDMVAGRPVETPAFDPATLRAYEQRLVPVMEARARATEAGERAVALEREAARLPATMERLSEVQLGEFRGVASRVEAEAEATRARLASEAEGIAAQRAELAGRTADFEAQRAEIERLREELRPIQERSAAIADTPDPETQVRLEAIEQDLAAPGLGADRRALLEGERESIRSTLQGDPTLRRERASLAQEVRGRSREIARREKALAAAEARAAATERKLAQREAKARTTGELTEGRTVSRRETVSVETRRAIETLAHDGYGVRLTRAESEEMARRLLTATDGQAEAALRGITDDLIARADAARRGRGERTVAGTRQEQVSEYWTDQTRRRIQGLAREVGYEMPPAEARVIAERMRGMTENDALALLDEVMLRPRTLAELLPGQRIPDPEAAPRAPEAEQPDETAITVNGQRRPDLEAKVLAYPQEAVEKVMADPKTRDSLIADLDRFRLEAGENHQVPVMVRAADGTETVEMRRLEDMVDEIDEDLKAATELRACASPQQEAAE